MTGLARFYLAHAGLLALVSCSKPQAPAGFIGLELNKIVSVDTTSLAGVDLDRLKTTAFYRARENRVEVINGLSNQFGVDARHDLSKILLMSAGKEAVFAIQGRFPKAVVANGLPETTIGAANRKILAFGSNALSFPRPDVALFGPGVALRHVMDGYEAGASGVSEELSENLARLSPSNPIWCVSRGQLPFAGIARRTDVVSILSNFAGYIDATATGIFIDANVHLKARIDCVSLEGAKRVDDGLRGGIGLARLALRDKQKDLLQVYDSVLVRKEDKTVFVRLDLEGDLVDKLLDRLAVGRSRTP